jgi:hypothetical protein
LIESSLVEFSNGFLFLDSLDFVELDLTLCAFLETTDGLSQLGVVVEVVSEGGGKVVEF